MPPTVPHATYLAERSKMRTHFSRCWRRPSVCSDMSNALLMAAPCSRPCRATYRRRSQTNNINRGTASKPMTTRSGHIVRRQAPWLTLNTLYSSVALCSFLACIFTVLHVDFHDTNTHTDLALTRVPERLLCWAHFITIRFWTSPLISRQ